MDDKSHHINLKKLVLLQFLSVGVFHLYWYYKNWVFLHEHHKIKTRPWILTLGLLVPLLNAYLVYYQFKMIKELADERNLKTYRFPSLVFLMYFFILFLTNMLLKLSFPADIVVVVGYLLPIIIMAIVQTTINRFEDKVAGKIAFSTTEAIIILIGLLFLLISQIV